VTCLSWRKLLEDIDLSSDVTKLRSNGPVSLGALVKIVKGLNAYKDRCQKANYANHESRTYIKIVCEVCKHGGRS